MPHEEVIRKLPLTTKVRNVFDASSQAKGCKSLNECIGKGDNIYQDLGEILLGFRTHRIAIMAEIEKAFLQISINEEDRDDFRFLWFKVGNHIEFSVNEMQEWRMTIVPFGATCSPFLLYATVLYHLEAAATDRGLTAKVLSQSFYVDDLVTGADTVEEASKLCSEAQKTIQAAGLTQRKWSTNSENPIHVLEQE